MREIFLSIWEHTLISNDLDDYYLVLVSPLTMMNREYLNPVLLVKVCIMWTGLTAKGLGT